MIFRRALLVFSIAASSLAIALSFSADLAELAHRAC